MIELGSFLHFTGLGFCLVDYHLMKRRDFPKIPEKYYRKFSRNQGGN